MKNRSIIIVTRVVLAVILFFSIARGLCHASGIAIGNESATVSFYGEERGVYYLITDPQGRRTGYDPISKQTIEEFPAAFDFSLNIRDEQNEKFHGSADFNLIPGTYMIEVFGVDLTSYVLSIRISRIIPGEGPVRVDIKTVTPEQITAIKARSTSFDFEGVIDKDQTSKFQFTYTSDPTKPAGTAEKIVEPGSLKQDITLCRKVEDIWITDKGDIIEVNGVFKRDYLIDSDGIMNSLLKKVEAMEASIARGQIKTARNQLNAFINEVNAQKDKHLSSTAVKILLEDAQYILGTLTEGK